MVHRRQWGVGRKYTVLHGFRISLEDWANYHGKSVLRPNLEAILQKHPFVRKELINFNFQYFKLSL